MEDLDSSGLNTAVAVRNISMRSIEKGLDLFMKILAFLWIANSVILLVMLWKPSSESWVAMPLIFSFFGLMALGVLCLLLHVPVSLARKFQERGGEPASPSSMKTLPASLPFPIQDKGSFAGILGRAACGFLVGTLIYWFGLPFIDWLTYTVHGPFRISSQFLYVKEFGLPLIFGIGIAATEAVFRRSLRCFNVINLLAILLAVLPVFVAFMYQIDLYPICIGSIALAVGIVDFRRNRRSVRAIVSAGLAAGLLFGFMFAWQKYGQATYSAHLSGQVSYDKYIWIQSLYFPLAAALFLAGIGMGQFFCTKGTNPSGIRLNIGRRRIALVLALIVVEGLILLPFRIGPASAGEQEEFALLGEEIEEYLQEGWAPPEAVFAWLDIAARNRMELSALEEVLGPHDSGPDLPDWFRHSESTLGFSIQQPLDLYGWNFVQEDDWVRITAKVDPYNRNVVFGEVQASFDNIPGEAVSRDKIFEASMPIHTTVTEGMELYPHTRRDIDLTWTFLWLIGATFFFVLRKPKPGDQTRPLP